MNNTTIVGPKTIGKSTICKQISKNTSMKYLSFDAFLDQKLKRYGGLIKVLLSGQFEEFLKDDISKYLNFCLSI